MSICEYKGVALIPSPYVPDDRLLVMPHAVVYYSSRRVLLGRKRRPHGRTNGKQRRETVVRVHQPFFDKALERLKDA